MIFFLFFFYGFPWCCVTCTCKGSQWCPVTLTISLIGFILFEFVWQPRCLCCVVDKTKAMEKRVIMSAPKHTRATFKYLEVAQHKRPWMCSSARGLSLLYLYLYIYTCNLLNMREISSKVAPFLCLVSTQDEEIIDTTFDQGCEWLHQWQTWLTLHIWTMVWTQAPAAGSVGSVAGSPTKQIL